MRATDGQASVELLAVVPALLAAGAIAAQVLAAGACRELAAGASAAGARALLQDRDPRTAAARALPGWAAGRARVVVVGREVRVELRPPAVVPGLAAALTARGRADAGPEAP